MRSASCGVIGGRRSSEATGLARAAGRVLCEPVRHQLHGERSPVVDEHGAVAVDDLATRRLDLDLPHAVVVRLGEVLVTGKHLEVPQAEEDDREEHEGDSAQDGHAQRELWRDRQAAIAGGDGIDHARESGERPPVV